VSQSLFRRMFGRSSKLAPAVTEAIAELDRLAQERPLLARHARTLAEALPVICADVAMDTDWQLPTDRIAEKWSGGVPLLRGESLPIDATGFTQRWLALCDILAGQVGKEPTRALAAAMRQGDLSTQELAGWVLAGQVAALHSRADVLGLDGELAATVLRWTLFPLFTQLQQALSPRLPSESWPHGFCPICGSWPILGEFRGLEQVRFLRCGLCAAAWEFPRLRCPFCDNTDHRQLGYLHQDGDEGKRAATCDACHGYVKMVTALTPLTPPRLLVADVATLHLDLIASERGYAAP
jgi:FdhE protein